MRTLLSLFISASLLCACRPAHGPADPAAGIAFVSDRDGSKVVCEQWLVV